MDHHLGSQLIYCRLIIEPDHYRRYDTIPMTKVRKVREEIESYIHETDGAERSPCPRGSGVVGGSSEGMGLRKRTCPLTRSGKGSTMVDATATDNYCLLIYQYKTCI